jgi:predicted O-methyltransferase YrrM
MFLRSIPRRLLRKSGYRLLRESEFDASVMQEAKRLQLQSLAYDPMKDGSLAREEYEFLRLLVEKANAFPGAIVEIGTLFGRTTSKIAVWKLAAKKVFTVDNYAWNPWRLTPEMHYQLTSLVLQYLVDTGHVVQVRGDKDEWLGQHFEQPPALVFCDADHSYEATAMDIKLSLRAGAKIVCGHDYSREHPGVIRAVNEYGGPESVTGTLWVLRTA